MPIVLLSGEGEVAAGRAHTSRELDPETGLMVPNDGRELHGLGFM
jgi:hypothetical protein